MRYSALGEVRYSIGTTVTDKLYTGQQQKVEIELDYYPARFYNTVIAPSSNLIGSFLNQGALWVMTTTGM